MRSDWLRVWVPFGVGLVIGVVGVVLLRGSLPGEEGSSEDRIAVLESELKIAKNKVLALQGAENGEHPGHKADDTRNRLRGIAEAIREGRPVTPDDLLRASQPLLRDLSPIFDRVRVRIEREAAESLAGEIGRRYELNPAQVERLRKWLDEQAERSACEWSELVQREGTTIEDLLRASHERRMDRGLDEFMATLLQGEKLERFREERLAEKAERVQAEADRRMERLDRIVGLNERQRDEIFAIYARASGDYVPGMQIAGATGMLAPGAVGQTAPAEAVKRVLTPEQRATLEQEIRRREEKAARELATMGLSLPENWNPLDWDEF